MKTVAVICDVCGCQEVGEGRNWIRLKSLEMTRNSEKYKLESELEICGERCLMKFVSDATVGGKE